VILTAQPTAAPRYLALAAPSHDSRAGAAEMVELKPWTLPLIVAAIVVPLTAGFLLAGPALGVALGFLAVATLVWIAVRQRPRGPIETASAADDRRHLLVVLSRELDDPGAVGRIAETYRADQAASGADVLVLAPAKSRLLDRWATDLGPARDEAQRKLVLSVASLGKADVAAEGAVGDEDLVQAVEDRLREFPADEVILVTGPPGEDPEGNRAAAELRERLRQPFEQLIAAGGP
jgi:hypothetical protein